MNKTQEIYSWIKLLHFHIQSGTGKPTSLQHTEIEWTVDSLLNALGEHIDTISPNTVDRWRKGETIPSGIYRTALIKVFWPTSSSRQSVAYENFKRSLADASASKKSRKVLLSTQSPTTSAQDEKLLEWENYHKKVSTEFKNPIFGSSIMLSDLYIPPVARISEIYRANDDVEINNTRSSLVPQHGTIEQNFRDFKPRKIKKVDLYEHLLQWIVKPQNLKDSVKLIRGGPGSGKSSFCKYLCSRLIDHQHAGNETQNVKLLYIPMQMLEFNDSEIADQINKFFLQTGLFNTPPIDHSSTQTNNDHTLLIFDGLDELSRYNGFLQKRANKFIEDVLAWLQKRNFSQKRYSCLFLGRDAAIEAASIELSLAPEHVLYLLPFQTKPWKSTAHSTIQQSSDQREEWWTKWHKHTPQTPSKLPAFFNNKDIVELSVDPLLLYIMSRENMYLEHQKIKSKKEIYDNLFNKVVSDWHNNEKQILAPAGIEFIPKLLELIAASTWVNNGRTTSVLQLRKHCTVNPDFQNELNHFLDQKLTNNAILSFYFNIHSSKEEIGIEFTHKSFSEYLNSRYLVRLLDKTIFETSNITDLCDRWVRAFAGATVTVEIYKFLDQEIHDWNIEKKSLVKSTLTIMLENFLDLLHNSSSSIVTSKASLGAIQTLLGVLQLSHQKNENQLIEIKWPSHSSANDLFEYSTWGTNRSEWHWRTKQSYVPLKKELYMNWFADMNFSKQTLHNQSFINLTFTRTSFVSSRLAASSFIDCICVQTDFSDSSLQGTIWHGTNLHGAQFKGANVSGADFRFANGLKVEQFVGAHIDEETKFSSTLLREISERNMLPVSNTENMFGEPLYPRN